jgi:RNA polymerase sigma-70 factor (ECF subfamily)
MAMTIDDPRLIASFRAGENDAFEALVRAHRPALYRHALRKLSDHAAAEDAVQETFMRAYKSRTRVNDDWQLRPWLHQICANVCIDEANRRRKETAKTSRWAIVDMPSRGIAPELERELGLDADHSEMTAAILSLPATYQEALSLRYVEELEYDEIAEILDISEDNVRARVSRASKAVRVLLRPVAAIIAFLAVVFGRRGSKSAMAASVDASAAAHTSTAATHVAHTASTFAPLLETAQAVAIQAPAAMPIFSKAAIGITMVVAATAPVTAPVVIDRFRTETPATSAVDAPVDDASASVVVTDSTPAPGADSDDEAIGADTDDEAIGADGSAGVPGGPADDATPPADEVVDTPLVTIAPGQAEYGTESAIENGLDPNSPDDDASADSVPAGPAIPVATEGVGGDMSASGLTVSPSGPRLDLSGPATLSVAGTSVSGTLTGRANIAADVDASDRHRFDAVLTLDTADGPVQIRLIGYAVAQSDDTYAVTGAFRASAGDLGLADTGSFTGSLSPDLRLTLSV